MQITDSVLGAIKEACKFDKKLISIGLINNYFVVACNDIRGLIVAISVEPTSHKDFAINIDKKILPEVIKQGYLEVIHEEDSPTVNLRGFKTYEESSKWLDATIAYSMAPAIDDLLTLMITNKKLSVQCPTDVFTPEVEELMQITNNSLNIKGNIAYSIGSGFSFYKKYESSDYAEMEKLTFEPLSMKYIVKNIRPYSRFFSIGNTFVMENGVYCYTWRGSYYSNQDIDNYLNQKPISTYRISISPKAPFVMARAMTKLSPSVVIDLKKSEITIESMEFKVNTKIIVEGIDVSREVKDIIIDQKYLRYIASNEIKLVQVFKKFIRVLDTKNNLTIDIGCDIHFRDGTGELNYLK